MAFVSDADLSVLRQWSKTKLSLDPVGRSLGCGQLKVIRQGHGKCRMRRSLANTPLAIGDEQFDRGIATHSQSEIEVTLPSPAKLLQAKIGRDQNAVTRGYEANIVFIVEAGGTELFRSTSLRGGEAPIDVKVPLGGNDTFTLRVEGNQDWGHADWADAKVVLETGDELWLDELPMSGLSGDGSSEPPFSFVYGGRKSSEFLDSWKRNDRTEHLDGDRTVHVRTYADPETGLEVTWEVTLHADFAAAEWLLYFANHGSEDTPILEDVQALDTAFNWMSAEGELKLHSAIGSVCAVNDFAPVVHKLEQKSSVKFAPEGGRSSSGTMPYFNIEAPGGGAILAIGWTGQWAASFDHDDPSLNVRAGMELTHLKLHPGERIRTPGIALLFWKENRLHGHNLWRSFVLERHSPRPGGKPLQPPMACGVWGMIPEQEHMARINTLAKNNIPFDYYWIDAGWFGECTKVDEWWVQAGNWYINRSLYPRGMKPISDELHKMGKRLLLWFDTERVYENTMIHKEHPEWLLSLPDSPQYVFNMGIPEARLWMTDLISGILDEEGIDVYRQDANVDFLAHWRTADAPDRLGMTEIKHVEGLYAFLDELLRRHPNLIIDNCASGGRRLDLEMTSRSIPLWRSDLQCSPDYCALGSQSQTHGIAYWLPLSTCGSRESGDTYDFRSAICSGICGDWRGLADAAFPHEWARRMMEEMSAIREYFLGDFYPLTNYSIGDDVWLAHQFDRPDLGEGVLLAYRRENCPYPTAYLKCKALDPDADYEVSFLGENDNTVVSGRILVSGGLKVTLEEPASAMIIVYRQIGPT
ncbi:MAG: alpha-galactosidase [Armatimonadota bacterium]